MIPNYLHSTRRDLEAHELMLCGRPFMLTAVIYRRSSGPLHFECAHLAFFARVPITRRWCFAMQCGRPRAFSDAHLRFLAINAVVLVGLTGKFVPPLRHVEQQCLVSGVGCLLGYADTFGCVASVLIGSRHLLSPQRACRAHTPKVAMREFDFGSRVRAT
jgi:hypothetical protein